MKIKISKDYSETPLGRFPDDGDYNGERFRDEFLAPNLRKLKEGEKLEVDIDDTEGYGSSFLDEAFGGLVRKGYFTKKDLHGKLNILTADPEFKLYESLIWKYIDESVISKVAS